MLGDVSKVEHIYIAVGYTDMRKQSDGLAALVQTDFNLDPFSNSLFLFCGRNTRMMKALTFALMISLPFTSQLRRMS